MDDTLDPAEGPTSVSANESNSPIVSDIGSSRARIGFAGSAAPDADFASWFATTLASSSTTSPEAEMPVDIQVGSECLALPADGKELLPVISNGVVANWDAFEAVWNHASSSILKLDLKNKFVLMSESALASPSSRAKHAELMFERFGVGGIFIAREAPLALYACARTTGVVLNVGQDYSCASPVREGFVLESNVRSSMLAGQALTQRTLQLLQDSGVSVTPRYAISRETTLEGVELVSELVCLTWFGMDG
jgi:actin-related protein